MDAQLNQIYQLEKEMLDQKSKYENSFNNEMVCLQNIKIFEYSLSALRTENDGAKVFQPLGKAFLRRGKHELIKDLESLLETNQKSVEEHKKMREHFEGKKGELEGQLVEMTRGLKLA